MSPSRSDAAKVAPPGNAPCPLCTCSAAFFARDRRRRFHRCPCCALIFAHPADHLDHIAERAEYDLHHNDSADPDYRRFLSRLSRPLLSRLEAGMRGLDFGSGPGPVLAAMLQEAGMRMALYDPFYAPAPEALDERYDFVSCSEVVEHFNRPADGWRQLSALLCPGGWLGVMTGLSSDRSAEGFLKWRYKDDLTHVSFYSLDTMAWIAGHFGLELHPVDDRVVLFRRPAGRLLP